MTPRTTFLACGLDCLSYGLVVAAWPQYTPDPLLPLLMLVVFAWVTWAVSFLMLYLILLVLHVTIPAAMPNELGNWYFPATVLGPWIVVTLGATAGLAGRPVLVAKLFGGLFAIVFGLTLFSTFTCPPI